MPKLNAKTAKKATKAKAKKATPKAKAR